MITIKKSCEVAIHFNSTLHSLQDFSFFLSSSGSFWKLEVFVGPGSPLKLLLLLAILLLSACKSSLLIDPKMSDPNCTLRAATVWNKLTRYQHHCNFLKICLDSNVIPKGFNLNFNLAFNVDNHELQASSTDKLHKTSLELCNLVLRSSQEKVKNLQQELQLAREKLLSLEIHMQLTHGTIYAKRMLC